MLAGVVWVGFVGVKGCSSEVAGWCEVADETIRWGVGGAGRQVVDGGVGEVGRHTVRL